MSLLFGLLKYHFEFTNIHYKEPTLDLKNTKIDFTDIFHHPMLKVHFPAIKKWHIIFHSKVNTFILPKEADIVWNIEDLDLKFNTEF